MNRQEYDLTRVTLLAHLPGDLDAAVLSHGDIQDHEIRPKSRHFSAYRAAIHDRANDLIIALKHFHDVMQEISIIVGK
nr:hypothetical protein [Granulicella sp. L46]